MSETARVLLVLVVFLLASMRLTRLINADTITDFVRVAIGNRVRSNEIQTDEAFGRNQIETARAAAKRASRWNGTFKFVQCPWCISWWVALPGAFCAVWVIKYGWTIDWWAIVPLALAVSHLVGVLARFADTDEIELEDTEGEDAAA